MFEARVPDEHLVRRSVAETCTQVATQAGSARELHRLLQNAVAHLSGRFALSAQTEYVLPGFRGDRDGRLDVVWQYGTIPVVAFEIDWRYRAKSLRKLLAVNANLRFWICSGIGDAESVVRRIDPLGMIRVIPLWADPGMRDGHSELRTNKLTNSRSISLSTFCAPRATEPKSPNDATSFWRQMVTSLSTSNGYARAMLPVDFAWLTRHIMVCEPSDVKRLGQRAYQKPTPYTSPSAYSKRRRRHW